MTEFDVVRCHRCGRATTVSDIPSRVEAEKYEFGWICARADCRRVSAAITPLEDRYGRYDRRLSIPSPPTHTWDGRSPPGMW